MKHIEIKLPIVAKVVLEKEAIDKIKTGKYIALLIPVEEIVITNTEESKCQCQKLKLRKNMT